MSFDLLVLAGLVYLSGLIWAVMDIVRSDFKDGATKIVFMLLVLLLPAMGVAIYMFYKRKWIVLPIFVLLIIGFISISMYITADNYNKMVNATNETPLEKTKASDDLVGPMFPIDKIMVTTKEGSNINLSLAIELSDKDKAQILVKDKQKIEQIAITIAGTKTAEEIKKGAYKKELMEKLDSIYPSTIKTIYIINPSK